jgi:hypothetical protein
MGYRSDITIAITKELYVKCQLLQNIPKALLEEKRSEKNGVCFWFLTGWKWYEEYPEVQAIEEWFEWCADEDENPDQPVNSNPNDETEVAVFGALRLGEGDGNGLDEESWGSPWEFNIHVNNVINNPLE